MKICQKIGFARFAESVKKNLSRKDKGAFGRYGLRRSVAEKMIKIIKDYEKKYPHFILMDENKMGNHDYDDEKAFNCDHLSYKGAEKLTKRLDSLIQTLKINWDK